MEFYAFVRDEGTARKFHEIHTTWIEPHEIDYLLKFYDYKGIQEFYEKNYLNDPFVNELAKINLKNVPRNIWCIYIYWYKYNN